jgi:hypothetical protein
MDRFFSEAHCKRFYGDHAFGFSGFFVRSLLCLGIGRENAAPLLVIMLCMSFAAMHLHFIAE